MTLHTQAKMLLRYQTIGIFCMMFIIVGGVFTYFLFKDNDNHQKRLNALNKEIVTEQKKNMKLAAENAKEYILFMNAQAEDVLKKQTKNAVDQAIRIANSIYEQQKNQSSLENIEQLIIAALRNTRYFNNRGYYFIQRLDGYLVMYPPFNFKEYEGSFSPEDSIIEKIKNSVDNPQKSGYSHYQWYLPEDNQKMMDKITYSKVFEPFGWAIGIGDYIESFEKDLRKLALERLLELKSQNGIDFNILDTKGNLIGKSKHNTNFLMYDPDYAPMLHQDLIDFASKGGGFINYAQLPNQRQDVYNRLAYVEAIPSLNWVIVTDISPSKVEIISQAQESILEESSKKDIKALCIVLLITAMITFIIVAFYTKWNKKLFQNYQDNIDTKQKKINNNLKALNLASSVFESSNDAILVTDTHHNIVTTNPAFSRITGYTNKEVQGKNARFLGSEQHDEAFRKNVMLCLEEDEYWQGEIWNKHKNGQAYLAWLTITASKNEQQEIINYIFIFSDISQRKQTEKKLSYLSDHDPLTKLVKRHLVADRANKIINFNTQENPRSFALMLIDLDRFKNINDTLGHNVGDDILQKIALRLSHSVRSSDVVCRLSGDEFIILIDNNKAKAAATLLARRILNELSSTIKIKKHDLVITSTIGISIYPKDGNDFDALLKNADAALNHMKTAGGNNFQFFTFDMHERASEKLMIEKGLREAIVKKQFKLNFQAQFDSKTNQLIGCEVLLRWVSPELGNVPPDKFIPIAEDTGLIIPIGQWVLNEACKQAVNWQKQGFKPIQIAINVSSQQFKEDIVEVISKGLTDSTLSPNWLEVEVTETAFMEDPEFTKIALIKLKELGLKIALDDFGTGYSSLAYLKKFPIDKLKIDRTFISDLPGDKEDLAITRSILDVANNLNLTTVAEGVETEEQKDLLADLGCQQIQGFLMCRPMPADEFSKKHMEKAQEI